MSAIDKIKSVLVNLKRIFKNSNLKRGYVIQLALV